MLFRSVKSLVKEIKVYAKNAKFYWCQEEPKNMGAWLLVRDYIQWNFTCIYNQSSVILQVIFHEK